MATGERATDDGPVPALADRAAACAERLRAAESVLLVSHADADGLAAAAVATRALERAGIPHEVSFVDQLDAAGVAAVAERDADTVLFTDIGSGQLDSIVEHEAAGAFTPVVADHHQPADATTTYHLNPLLVGLDGAADLSGAGAAYVLARALGGERNTDLAALAVVGAVGDQQASHEGLTGANAAVAAEGVATGVLAERQDVGLYGRQTRTLDELLGYADRSLVPGVTGSAAAAASFLDDVDVAARADGEYRRWVDLDEDERRTVVRALVRRATARGSRRADEIVATTYTLPAEPAGTALRDTSEYATLLNATARYDSADVGLAVCLGDRDGALDRARDLRRTHRRNIARAIDLVERDEVERGEREHVRWFDGGDRIPDTVVGIVAGIALGDADGDDPMVGFAATDPDDGVERLKVSVRGSARLVDAGLDLSAAMRAAAAAVGGEGGGHDIAAGATVPRAERDGFLDELDLVVGRQLGRDGTDESGENR